MTRRFFITVFMFLVFSSRGLSAATSTEAARGVLQRLMPRLAPQITLALKSRPDGKDYFSVSGTRGHIHVQAATQPTLLYGVNWYLKYVAHLQVSTNGSQLGSASLILPAPSTPIEKPALYRWRYALNENVDGYSAPYWDDKRWQHEIDILALSGANAILIERGTDLVLYQTFRDAGYSDEAIRRWIVQPAHQNWELMGNMCCFEGPISMELLHKRAESAKHLVGMLRELGITPVLPGYFGIVPADFASLNPGAHVITQGDWNGFTRPGWIDPRDAHFATLAASFYRHQHDLYGDSTIYDMEIFQEGGNSGDVPVGAAAQRVQAALETAHHGALWMLMGWQNNPTQQLLSSIDTGHLLISDIEQGRIARADRDKEFHGAPWLFGGLWEFGGRTLLGAPLYDYAVRFPQMAGMPGSHIAGTALFTEGVDTDPLAFDLYTEMAWHAEPVDLSAWMNEYAERRYGGDDSHAQQAWQILLKTAYGYRADGQVQHGDRDAPHDSVFNAQPSLTAIRAGSWAPDEMRYKAADLVPALTALLQASAGFRRLPTYQYDVVDLARQVMADYSRTLLPTIREAYESKHKDRFARATAEWVRCMELQDALLQTSPNFLLGRWLSYVPQWSSSPAELATLNYDARSILTTWGDRKASQDGGLHEYGNRDWAGLTHDYYLARWQLYFAELTKSLETGNPPKEIDWYAFGDKWNRGTQSYSAVPHGDPYTAAKAIQQFIIHHQSSEATN